MRHEKIPLVELAGVDKDYPSPGGRAPTGVLRDVALTLAAGDRLAVVGPSGSGKSTLLNIVGALDRATRGEVFLNGRDLSALSGTERAAVRSEEVGFVFQAHHLLPQLSALENVLVPTVVHTDRDRRQALQARARVLLERVGLGDRLVHHPGQLSGGEQQRVALVRALINEPRLILADEPTGSLDSAASRDLAALLTDLNEQDGVSLIVATHSADLARAIGRVLELHDGGLRPWKENG